MGDGHRDGMRGYRVGAVGGYLFILYMSLTLKVESLMLAII